MKSEARATVYLVIAIFAVSSSSILIRLASSPPMVIAFYRQFLCFALFLPFLRGRGREALSRRDAMLLVLSGFFLAVHFATWITSLSRTTVAHATLFVDLQPVWAAILGALLLRERLGLLEVVAVFVVTAGGILTLGGELGGGRVSLIGGDMLALTGGMAGAVYLLIGRSVRARISWARYMYSVYYLSAAWLLVFYACMYRGLPVARPSEVPLLLAMAVGPGIAGHGLINLSIRSLKAYVVNTALLGEPVLATILAYFLFGEKPDVYFYAGAFLVLSGLVAIFRLQASPQNHQETPSSQSAFTRDSS